MDPAVIGTGSRLASRAVSPLVKKLFVRPGPGAGLADKPVRLDALVSFTGEKRKLTGKDLAKLARELVHQALRAGERPIAPDEQRAVADALARTLHALGDLTLTDVEAVELGHEALARRLREAAAAGDLPSPEHYLSADATYFYERLLTATCLQILHFFTQRSTFVAATLVAQSRRQGQLIALVDELIARSPLPGAEDVAFEERYLAYAARRHGKLTIFGIDLANSPGKWPLDAAYMSLEATSGAAITRSEYVRQQELGGWRPPVSIDEDEALEATIRELNLRATAPRPADQALTTHDRVLLRGEAGSGKTTLVQWLAVSAARQGAPDDDRMSYLHDRVPYVLPLRTLTRHGERLPAPKDFLAAVDCPLSGEQPNGWESRVLRAGRALVLIDGIDEVPDTERARTRAWMSDLIDAYPGNRWLVTSRPSAVREDWLADEAFTELTLSPMGSAEVAAFIRRWHSAATTGAADEDTALSTYESQLLEAVRTKPDLGLLATNPLMCGLICALHRDRRGFLPLGRKDLYTAALSMLLIRRDRERHMDVPELREEPQLQLLQRLAYWLIRNGRTVMDRSRAETIIADALPSVPEVAALGDAHAVFEHFLQRSGLLREPGPDTVDFIHRTFQDFLGARAAVDEGDFGVLAQHGADDQWADVIRMAVAQGRPRDRAELLEELIAFGDARNEQERMRVHLLAAACLEHAAELAPAVRGEVERRTAELIPPRTPQEANKLIEVGPVVLDLLPDPGELSDRDAWLVALTATNIPSDAAVPFLSRLARHPGLASRSQLMWGWNRYDCRLYAEHVIAQLNDGETEFTLHNADQVMELERLGIHPKLLGILATVSPATASRLIVACEPTSLSLWAPPAHLSPEALAALHRLEALRLFDIDEHWSLSLFPTEAPLRTIGLYDSSARMRQDDFELLERWPELRWLIFGGEALPASAEHWRILARLPLLEKLNLPIEALAHAPHGLRLPGVKAVSLNDMAVWASPRTDVEHLMALFPNLAELRVPAPWHTELGPLPASIRLDVYHLSS
ncbi:NACHT domain-containing protein [Streptomyces sp. NPDC059009]|uniref:NACHT domain-containing protein n=1 Tax=Streptomyces sp. NPDC059009 TaxID=3346694 RepID=UPI0036961D1F